MYKLTNVSLFEYLRFQNKSIPNGIGCDNVANYIGPSNEPAGVV